MADSLNNRILGELAQIAVPGLDGDLVSLGLVSEITETGGKVVFSITVPDAFRGDFDPLRAAAQERVESMDGVKSALIVLTAARDAPTPSQQLPELKASKPVGRDMRPAAAELPGVAAIIAVASGKGGVGKSTTAANIALALAKLGQRVGLLDADIYGPSMPRLMGITGRPDIVGEKIMPMDGHGIKVMSMGFLMEEDNPVIWRGPMIVSALMQMVREVNWGTLDVLVLDMPPGTGDAQLTMAQQVPLAGAVIVSTPQDLALIDARKGLKMFENVKVPILGIIENMSNFTCPHCGEVSDIFGHGGAQDEAIKLGVPFLGAIPLHMDIRKHSDEGTPTVVVDPDGPHTKIYTSIALNIATQLRGTEDEA
ncbi:MAG: Mrp/NBP35 family ATP-binding protein [Paracoccaceae bacterium]